VTKKRTKPASRIRRSSAIEELWTELNSINVRNHQSTRRVQMPLLRRIARTLVSQLLHKKYVELGVSLVEEAEMAQLNEDYMGHKGSTEVIALDYCEVLSKSIAGEIFVCVDEACFQAKRFRSTWQGELVRYVVHGALHLSGYDDQRAKDRRRMKEAEEQLLGELAKRFRFSELAGKKPGGRGSKAERTPKPETRSRVRQ